MFIIVFSSFIFIFGRRLYGRVGSGLCFLLSVYIISYGNDFVKRKIEKNKKIKKFFRCFGRARENF